MRLKVYHYPKCSSCRKAIKFLTAEGLDFQAVDIVEQPPDKQELRAMLKHQGGAVRKLFNTSGLVYREMGLRDRLPSMAADEAIVLLAQHGKLVKRPFLLTEETGLVGFREDEWRSALNLA